jgi:hypothetical protein
VEVDIARARTMAERDMDMEGPDITRHIRHMDTRIPARVPVLPMPHLVLAVDAQAAAVDVPVVVTAAGITVTDNPL